MIASSITIVLFTGVAVLPWIFPLVWEPLDCHCAGNYFQENCEHSNADCWAKGLTNKDHMELEVYPCVSFTLLGLEALHVLPGVLQWYQACDEATVRFVALFVTVAAFPLLTHALQINFVRWGWKRFCHIWVEDKSTFRLLPREKLCNLCAWSMSEDYCENSKQLEHYSVKSENNSVINDLYCVNNKRYSVNNDIYCVNNDSYRVNNKHYSVNNDNYSVNHDLYCVSNKRYSVNNTQQTLLCTMIIHACIKKSFFVLWIWLVILVFRRFFGALSS